jgi:hypothetical protein
MGIKFKLDGHTVRNELIEVCEVWVNDNMVATIYPSQSGTGIKLLSRHVSDAGTIEMPGEVMQFDVEFEFRPLPDGEPRAGK